MVQDPKLIKDICIKDFDHFVDRVVFDVILKVVNQCNNLYSSMASMTFWYFNTISDASGAETILDQFEGRRMESA